MVAVMVAYVIGIFVLPCTQAMIIRGNNVGRVGTIVSHEHHAGSYDIIHMKDRSGSEFTTRLQNVYVSNTCAFVLFFFFSCALFVSGFFYLKSSCFLPRISF
jgi:hypothetical protein